MSNGGGFGFSGFGGKGGAVSQLIAGTGIALSPASGIGVVTINSAEGSNILIVDGGLCSTYRCGVSNSSYGSYSFSGGGQCNTANGNHSFIGGGLRNCTGACSVSVGGLGNSASGIYSFTGGGKCNVSSGAYSSSLGFGSCAYLYGQVSNANGTFSTNGDAQNTNLIARSNPSIATGGTSILSLDGSGTTNLITPAGSNRAWNVFAQWVAVVASISGTANGVSVGDIKTRNDSFYYKIVSGVGSIGNVTTLGTSNDLSMALSNISYTNASGSLQLTFTGATFLGGGTITYKVVSKLQITEISW